MFVDKIACSKDSGKAVWPAEDVRGAIVDFAVGFDDSSAGEGERALDKGEITLRGGATRPVLPAGLFRGDAWVYAAIERQERLDQEILKRPIIRNKGIPLCLGVC